MFLFLLKELLCCCKEGHLGGRLSNGEKIMVSKNQQVLQHICIIKF